MLFNSTYIEIFNAYCKGFFPTLDTHSNFFYYSPETRPLLPISGMHVGKTLQRVINQELFEIKYDTDFLQVIKNCVREEDNWITDEVIHLYNYLFKLGYVHSVSCYKDGELVGGLYGLAVGAGFFIESQFTKVRDASKVAVYHLIEELQRQKFEFIDCQIKSDHLESLGAIMIDDKTFSVTLNRAIRIKTKWGFDLNEVIKLKEYNLETTQLLINGLKETDIERVLELSKKPLMHEYTLINPLNTEEKFLNHLARAKESNAKGIPDALAIRLKETGLYIGSLYIFYPIRELPTLEIAIELDPEYWGNGYGKMAFKKAIEFIKEAYPVQRIQARAVVENKRSNALLKSVGFNFEGTLLKSFWHNGRSFDQNYYGITDGLLPI